VSISVPRSVRASVDNVTSHGRRLEPPACVLMDRVEVLSDSTPIAGGEPASDGVINIILKKDVECRENGLWSHADGESVSLVKVVERERSPSNLLPIRIVGTPLVHRHRGAKMPRNELNREASCAPHRASRETGRHEIWGFESASLTSVRSQLPRKHVQATYEYKPVYHQEHACKFYRRRALRQPPSSWRRQFA